MRDAATRCPRAEQHTKSLTGHSASHRKRRCICGAFHVYVLDAQPSRSERLIRRKLREMAERAEARAKAKAASEKALADWKEQQGHE